MRIAFFTHHFLEPTHHAIAQILNSLPDCKITVFAKDFADQKFFNLSNIEERVCWTEGPISNFTNKNFDVAHAVFDGKSALRAGMAAKLSNIPFILSFHGGFDTKSKIFDLRHQEWTRNTIEAANFVTVVSPTDEMRLREIGVTRQIETIPVPIDVERIPPPKQRNLGHLITIGRMIPKKGIDVAIKTISFLPNNFTLLIVGDGPSKTEFENLAKSLNVEDRINWTGLQPLKETLSKMQESDILLHLARVAADGNAEGNPQVILWAQAMGLPVISTPTGSITDIIENNKSGILVEAENPNAAAQAVINLSSDSKLRYQLEKGGVEKVTKTHLLPNVSEKVYSLYKRAIKGESSEKTGN